MNRTIKDATVRRFHYDAHDQFSNHLADFVQAYNFAKRLKTLKGLTPYEFICKAWTNQPERFTLNPGLFNALFFGGMGRVSLKCHTPTQTAL